MLEITNRARGVVPASSIVLIVLVVSGALLTEKPFDSARPANQANSIAGAQGINVPLWADPFSVRHGDEFGQDTHASPMDSTNITLASALAGQVADLSEKDTAGWVARMVDVMEELSRSQKRNLEGEVKRKRLKLAIDSLEKLKVSIRRARANQHEHGGRLTIMFNMSQQGDEQSTIEDRRRERVALAHALIGEGFKPATPGNLDYLHVPSLSVSILRGRSCYANSGNLLVPYEWYSAENLKNNAFPSKILVLWLEDDGLEDPVATIENILNAIAGNKIKPNPDELDIRIIGPSSSSVLEKMYDPASSPEKNNLTPRGSTKNWPQLEPETNCEPTLVSSLTAKTIDQPEDAGEELISSKIVSEIAHAIKDVEEIDAIDSYLDNPLSPDDRNILQKCLDESPPSAADDVSDYGSSKIDECINNSNVKIKDSDENWIAHIASGLGLHRFLLNTSNNFLGKDQQGRDYAALILIANLYLDLGLSELYPRFDELEDQLKPLSACASVNPHELAQSLSVKFPNINDLDLDWAQTLATLHSGYCSSIVTRQISSRSNSSPQTPVQKSAEPDFRWHIQNVPIISHRATVDDDLLKLKFNKPRELNKFTRIIASDSKVTEKLIDELLRRGIRLCSAETNVLLILEADSIYGRGYEKAFQSGLNRECKTATTAKIKVARFFELIDGKSVNSNTGDNNGALPSAELLRRAVSGDTSILNMQSTRHTERPSGAHQLDYVRRMAKELEHYNHKVDVIGIVGSDVYDKLLVIQAIRSYLKRPMIFTTDASALFAQPEFYSYNQNLLIASGHGLVSAANGDRSQLRDCKMFSADSRKQTEATSIDTYEPLRFRDNYQTGFYRAVLRAICPEKNEHEDHNEHDSAPSGVKLFEVGRKGIVEISSTTRLTKTQFRLSVGFLIFPLLMLQVYLVSRRVRYPKQSNVLGHKEIRTKLSRLITLNWLVVVAIIAGLVIVASYPETQERILLFQGISSIPTLIFRISALLVAISLLNYGVAILTANFENLKRYFRGSNVNKVESYKLGMTRVEEEMEAVDQPVKSDKPQHLRHPTFDLFLIRLKRNVIVQWCLKNWDIVFSIGRWEQEIYGDLSRSGRACATKKWKPRTAENVWKQYGRYGSWRYRLGRTLPAWILTSLVFWYVIYEYYGQPHLMREMLVGVGNVNIDLAEVLMTGSALGSLFAVLLAGDSLKLCTTFVKHHQFDYIKWPTIPRRAIYKNLTSYACSRVASLEIIMRRTEAISSIIVFPFLVIFLLVMARSNIFDGWTWNAGVIGIYGGLSLYMLFRSAMLQQAANNTRKKIFVDLQRENAKIKTGVITFHTPADKEAAETAIKEAVEYVADLKRGLYAPVIGHPLFQAIAWPTTAAGLITITQLLW